MIQPGDNLQAALDALTSGAVLRLAAGEYRLEVPLRLTRGVRLVGAGAMHTRIVRQRTPHAHIAEAHPPAGEVLVLEELAIAWDDADGSAYLFQSDVLVVAGGHLALRGCRLAGSASEHARSNDMYGGSGLRLVNDAVVRAEACEIVSHGGHGVMMGERATLGLADCEVSDNRGAGLLVVGAAVLEARTTTFERNARGGLVAADDAAVTLVETVVQANRRFGVRLDTTMPARLEGCTLDSNAGPGLAAGAGHVTLTGGAIRRNSGDGVAIAEAGHVTVVDLVIEKNGGFGVHAAPGATGDLTRAAIFDNRRGGVEGA